MSEPTALDVALELVATKLAIQVLVSDVVTSTESDALDAWAYESPVPLPMDKDGRIPEDTHKRLLDRAYEIENEMLAAAGRFLLNRSAAGAITAA